MSNAIQRRNLLFFSAVAAVVAVIWLMFSLSGSRTQSPGRETITPTPQPGPIPNTSPVPGTAPGTATAVSATAGRATRASLAPGVTPSERALVFLVLRIEKGTVRLVQQTQPEVPMPLPVTVSPVRGLYHRVVSADGTMLAQGTMPDPRVVYHDEPREEGTTLLRGGSVRLDAADFNVRCPALPGMSRLELFEVDENTDWSKLTTNAKGYLGSISLQAGRR